MPMCAPSFSPSSMIFLPSHHLSSENMMQRKDAEHVHDSSDVYQVPGAKIGIIDFGYIGKLTNTDIQCFESLSIDPVFHRPSCIYCTECNTTLHPRGFSCASIIGGLPRDVNFFDISKGVIKGVYPSARLHSYCIGCERCGDPNYIPYAIDQAIADEVKVISMSVAPYVRDIHKLLRRKGGFHRKDDIIGRKTLEAYRRGVLTCSAIGNYGPIEESANNSWPWGLTVGACTDKQVLVADIEIAIKEDVPSVEILETIDYKNENFKITHRSQEISFNVYDTGFLTLRVPDDENWIDERVLAGDTATSTCTLLRPTPDYRSQILIPNVCSELLVLFCEETVAHLKVLHTKLQGGEIFVRISKSKFVNDERGLFVPKFSSRGPSRLYEDFITPDLVAPGYAIRMSHPSNIPLNYNEFQRTETTNGTENSKKKRQEQVKEIHSDNTIGSDTSFASSYVAACALVVASRYPDWELSAVKSALITTARSFAAEKIPGNEFAYGAGTIKLERALHPGLVYVEIYDHFLEYAEGKCEINELNLPTIAASFGYSNEKCIENFKRKLKDVNLSEGEEIVYNSKVKYFNTSLDPKVKITVEPPSLIFKPGEEKEFVLSVEIQPHADKFGYISAMLEWAPEKGGQSVCSPIHLYHYTLLDKKIWYEKEIDEEKPDKDNESSETSKQFMYNF